MPTSALVVVYDPDTGGLLTDSERDGRRFTNYTTDSHREALREGPALDVLRVWETADVRPGRAGEQWVNTLSRRQSSSVG